MFENHKDLVEVVNTVTLLALGALRFVKSACMMYSLFNILKVKM